MSKPQNGRIWLYVCPKCENNKITFYNKNDTDYCKCTKCGYKFTKEDKK